MSFSFKGCILGRYYSMKNQRRIVRFGQRSALIKKEGALDWERAAMLQVRRAQAPYEGEVALIASFYYDDKRADLDENLLLDMLQMKAPGKPYLGIVKNDNQFKAHFTRKFVDKLNPRVEFTILDLETFNNIFGHLETKTL